MITENLIKLLPVKIRSKVEKNTEFRKIMGNVNWLTLESIFRNLLGLVVVTFVARYLGPEQFGLMNYAVAFVTVFAVFASLGLDDIVIREIVSNPKNDKEYLGTTLLLKFIGSSLLLVITVFGISFLEPDNNLLKVFVLIYAFGYFLKSFDVIDLWFKSQVQSQYSVYARSTAFLIISLLKLLFIFTQSPLIAFVLLLSLEFFLASVFLVFFYYKKNKQSFIKWRFKLEVAQKLLKDSWPLILSGLAVVIYMRIDQVMIGNILGDASLGIYSAAVKISEAWYTVPVIITTSVFPAIIYVRSYDKKLYLKRIQILYDGFLWFTLFFGFIITFISSFIINLLYGLEYAGASQILSVHIWTGVFVFFAVVNGKYLVAENLTKVVLYMTTMGAVLNIFLNMLFINIYGPLGAAIASLISQMFSASLFLVFFSQTRPLIKMQFRALNFFRIFKYFRG